ncbi:hypothetical protein DPMN_042055 [Dreissena polymorpha]|uniref:Uncharacterized protein n=1 Tax=Dreissena polymorpha TaxID=45954 RepID=A0A9D4HYF4_DREPO|nr:hypothetical protein DPMN_042055 [Dreissena polymorpha]
MRLQLTGGISTWICLYSFQYSDSFHSQDSSRSGQRNSSCTTVANTGMNQFINEDTGGCSSNTTEDNTVAKGASQRFKACNVAETGN